MQRAKHDIVGRYLRGRAGLVHPFNLGVHGIASEVSANSRRSVLP